MASPQDNTVLTNALRAFFEREVKITSGDKGMTKEMIDNHIKGHILEYFKDNSHISVRKLDYTGSFYEKLKTGAADEVDIMVILESKDLKLEKVNDFPGWVKLKATDGSPFEKYANDDRYIIPEKILKSWMFSSVQKAVNKFSKEKPDLFGTLKISLHGPAVQLDINAGLSVDLVLTFEFDDEHYVAKPFQNNGPCAGGDHKLLFRQSFSVKEKAILRHMDSGDGGCRHILLRIVKTMVRNESALKGELSSYHLKTAFLRLIKTKDSPGYWHRDLLGDRFLEFITILHNALRDKSLPHYWIPSVNLLEDISNVVLENMAARLEKILTKDRELFKILGADVPDISQLTVSSVEEKSLIAMLRAFSKDMEVNISKEKKNTKDMFKIHVIEQVLKRCQEKYPKRISRFDVAGNLYDNLKTEGPDEEDATVLLILAKKKIVHEITQSGCALFLVKDASSEYAVDCSDEEGFLLPEKIIKWLFNLLQKESKSYQQSQDVIKINVSQLKQYSGVRLKVRDISIGYTLLVNVVPTLVAEEKVFSTSHLLLSTCLCPDDQPLERRWSPCFVLEEKKQLANMDTDGGCRHELFRVVKTIMKKEATFAKLVAYLKIIFLNFLENSQQDSLWRAENLADRFLEFLDYTQSALKSRQLRHQWMSIGGEPVNLLADTKPLTLQNMESRVARILSSKSELRKVLLVAGLPVAAQL